MEKHTHLRIHFTRGYTRPAIMHKGALAQFAGSPLSVPLSNPLELPPK